LRFKLNILKIIKIQHQVRYNNFRKVYLMIK